jgi:hypothetical protein
MARGKVHYDKAFSVLAIRVISVSCIGYRHICCVTCESE